MAENTGLPTFDFAQRLPGGFQFPARMSVLPLRNGELALVSPVPIDDSLEAELRALGEVSFLIAPNLLHHLYLAQAKERFPSARVLAPERLATKRPDLHFDGTLERDIPAVLEESVEVVKFDGAPKLDEFVFYHRARRTLVVTDLVFNITRPRGFLGHVLLALGGCHGRLAQSRFLRLMIRERERASASAQRILGLGFETLVMAHGDIVHEDAQARLADALRWLVPKRLALSAAR